MDVNQKQKVGDPQMPQREPRHDLRPLPFPIAELVPRGSRFVQDFRVRHFLRNTKFFSPSMIMMSFICPCRTEKNSHSKTFSVKPSAARRAKAVVPRSSLRWGTAGAGLVCPVQMVSASSETPIAPTGADTASRSVAKTPAARSLISDTACAQFSTSVKQLTET